MIDMELDTGSAISAIDIINMNKIVNIYQLKAQA